jgi:hypothetical protein
MPTAEPTLTIEHIHPAWNTPIETRSCTDGVIVGLTPDAPLDEILQARAWVRTEDSERLSSFYSKRSPYVNKTASGREIVVKPTDHYISAEEEAVRRLRRCGIERFKTRRSEITRLVNEAVALEYAQAQAALRPELRQLHFERPIAMFLAKNDRAYTMFDRIPGTVIAERGHYNQLRNVAMLPVAPDIQKKAKLYNDLRLATELLLYDHTSGVHFGDFNIMVVEDPSGKEQVWVIDAEDWHVWGREH